MITQTSTITIPISSKISEVIRTPNYTLCGVWLPVVTSTSNLFVQVSPDTTSANFVRAHNPPVNSGDYTISVAGQGSFAVTLVDLSLASPYMRIESQTFATASAALVV